MKRLMTGLVVLTFVCAGSAFADLTNDVNSVYESAATAVALGTAKVALAVALAVGLWSVPFVWRKIRAALGR